MRSRFARYAAVVVAGAMIAHPSPISSNSGLQRRSPEVIRTNVAPRECLSNNGLVYGPFRDGQGPDAGVYPTIAQIEEDLTFISALTRRIRIYGMTGPFRWIPQLARARGLRVMQGISLGRDRAQNENEIAAGLALAHSGLIDELIVGNEVLTGSIMTKDELIPYLRRVRREAPTTVAVSTAETWDKWQAHPDLAQDVDFVVAHFYPFWERHPIDGAAAYLFERYDALQSRLRSEYPLRDLKIVIGETGWPSGGSPLASGVIPSPENQRRFAMEFMTLACERSSPFYLFEAFDEEWKWQEGASGRLDPRDFPRDRTFAGAWVGSSWGIASSNGTVKSHFATSFDQPPRASRVDRDIFLDGQLATYYDIGVDSSGQRREWLTTPDDSLRMAYPSGQEWGAVFITVGTPTAMPRPWKDFSEYEVLSLELKGGRGGESVEIGVKDYAAPDDGSERKVTISGLTTEYRQYDILLSRFASSRFVVPDDLKRLYVVVEFVFLGRTAQTVHARNIRYKSTQ